MTDAATNHPEAGVAAETEKIVKNQTDVRKRVRDLVVQRVRERKLGLDELGGVAREVLDAAARTVDESVPENREAVLRQVVDGVSDAGATAATATRLALEEQRGEASSFTKEDLQNAVNDLRELEGDLIRTVEETAKKSSDQVRRQLQEIADHLKRTGSSVRPSVEAALRTAAGHPLKLAGEATKSGVNVARKGAAFFMHSVSGLFDAAGDLLAGEAKDEKQASSEQKPAE